MPDTFICPKVKWMEKKKKEMSFNDILVPDSITIKAKKKSFIGVWIVVNGIRLDWTSKLYNLITSPEETKKKSIAGISFFVFAKSIFVNVGLRINVSDRRRAFKYHWILIAHHFSSWHSILWWSVTEGGDDN